MSDPAYHDGDGGDGGDGDGPGQSSDVPRVPHQRSDAERPLPPPEPDRGPVPDHEPEPNHRAEPDHQPEPDRGPEPEADRESEALAGPDEPVNGSEPADGPVGEPVNGTEPADEPVNGSEPLGERGSGSAPGADVPGPGATSGGAPQEGGSGGSNGGRGDGVRPRGDVDHPTLKSLLGAWALSACSREEALAVEVHLTDCSACADEALRLRDAVRLLHQEESLDLDPLLRARVLEGCLGRRPARIPTPEWAGPYGAEAARLDALLRDLGEGYWKAPVDVRWFDGAPATRRFTVGQVIAHLTAVDGLVTRSLGLAGSGGTTGRGRLRRVRHAPELPLDPWQRTHAHWTAQRHLPGATLHSLWREQSLTLMRTVSFAGGGAGELPVDYGDFALPLQDAFLDRAFECWIHAGDIAEAVDYPYEPPPPRALHGMVDLAARLLPGALAERRRSGLAESSGRLLPAGRAGRSLRLEIEGDGGGDWYLPLDSPGATALPDGVVAHVAMDSVEFCQLAAGHVEPERAAAGRLGDLTAVRDVLYATASLSRM